MDLDLSWAVRWRAPLGLGMVGTDSEELRGDERDFVSTCVDGVNDAGDTMVVVAGGEVEAMAVSSCRGTGLGGPEMYGRDDAAGHQR